MTENAIKQVILDIIGVVAPDADLSDVKSDVRLRDQLDMDSMDFLDIVMELRKRYKIEVPKEDYAELADGIRTLCQQPDLFMKLSEGAAKRVREKCGKESTIVKEMRFTGLISGDGAFS